MPPAEVPKMDPKTNPETGCCTNHALRLQRYCSTYISIHRVIEIGVALIKISFEKQNKGKNVYEKI